MLEKEMSIILPQYTYAGVYTTGYKEQELMFLAPNWKAAEQIADDLNLEHLREVHRIYPDKLEKT